MTIPQHQVQNRLLSLLSAEDYAAVQPHLYRRVYKPREVLLEPGEPFSHICFPEAGLVSFNMPGHVEIEVGIVGREGFLGVSAVLGVDRNPLRLVSQAEGGSVSMNAVALAEAITESETLARLLSTYTHVFMMQAASTAYANAHFSVEQRLARWLLMMQDRIDGDELCVTHEFLAAMLCVRRPGVTVATHVLEGNGLIRARRGRIQILDRAGLASLCSDSYGLAEREYERLFGVSLSKDASHHEA